MNRSALFWFRRDLRLAGNPALSAALAAGKRVVPVYIHAPEAEADWVPGAASRWWLHRSLSALDGELRARGSRLIVRHGPAQQALDRLIAETAADAVYWNRLYEPAILARDGDLEQALQQAGIEVHHHNAALLFEPWTLATRSGAPYRVFTPYWKACLRLGLPETIAPAPQRLPSVANDLESLPLDSLQLEPRFPWDAGLQAAWVPGEQGAQARLQAFLAEAAIDYAENRDRPDRAGTSRLSPHLHFGEIGPHQVVAAIHRTLGDVGPRSTAGAEAYLRELGWREFAHHLLFHFPHTADRALDERFDDFPWASDFSDELTAWQRGQTGIPLVDAGMRELWQTGWMHNRARMIAASFLTKNLLVPWQQGARWFWDTLVDADLANNTLGWQWTAGCGADAAPYFRIFNPVLQGERFDPDGLYIERWVPELAGLPPQHRHAPWKAPQAVLDASGIRLGRDYPQPIVDLKTSRQRALDRFARIRR
ncbi:MAG: deoxyribodipyrimidine photo-lyase [Gammaproteobacteria bacterium]